jgi:hypothetical protein
MSLYLQLAHLEHETAHLGISNTPECGAKRVHSCGAKRVHSTRKCIVYTTRSQQAPLKKGGTAARGLCVTVSSLWGSKEVNECRVHSLYVT